jgi:pimeloyl-ACP methyl ester carboxylesterase
VAAEVVTMRLRRLVGGAVAGLGAVALGNRLLAGRAGDLPPSLPGTERTYRWRGFDVAYAEGGDPADPDLLLLHGVHAAASAREFEGVFETLAEEYHVLAPDLPGFGRTDRPPVTYADDLYRRFVADFATEHTEDAVCVATSLTGAYAAAVTEDAGFSRLVLVCPTDDTGPRRPWLTALFRSPLVGQGLFNLLVSGPSLRWFDRREGYYRGPDEETVAHQWRSAHQPGARFAPAAFAGGALTPETSLTELLADVAVPVTLVWGREATRPPLAAGHALASQADARLVVVDEARLLPHHEHPAEFVGGLSADLPRLDEAAD